MIVETTVQLSEMVASLRAAQDLGGMVAFDTEATSERPEDAALVGMSFATEDGRTWYVPVGHEEGPQLPLDMVLEAVAPLLEKGVVAYGSKYDIRLMAKHNVHLNVTVDGLSVVRLLGEVDYGVGLKETVERWFNEQAPTFKETLGKKTNAAEVPIEDLAPYAEADAWNTLRVVQEGLSRLSDTVKEGLLHYELNAMRIAAKMEDVGLPVDMEMLQEALVRGQEAVEQLRQDAIAALRAKNPDISPDLNLRSSKQLQEALFTQLGLPIVGTSKKTGNPSANKTALAKLAKDHPEVELITRYRSAATTVSRIEELLEAARERDGHHYVHASLNPAGAATGRWTSSSPNIQNHPRSPYVYEHSQGVWEFAVRDAIQAPPGYLIVSADYSQIELRVAAGFSQEPAWVEAFATGRDVHTATASAIFGIPPEEVTEDQRYKGKTLNFSMLFGATEMKVAELLDIEKDEAADIINRFWQGLPNVTSWVRKVHKSALKTGYVSTAFGRKRHLPDVFDEREWVRDKALRESVNTIIQGTAADLLKIGLTNQEPVADHFGAQLFLVVHDQFVWLVPEDLDLRAFAEAMEPAICPQLPGFPTILADWGIGERLGRLQKYDSVSSIPVGAP